MVMPVRLFACLFHILARKQKRRKTKIVATELPVCRFFQLRRKS